MTERIYRKESVEELASALTDYRDESGELLTEEEFSAAVAEKEAAAIREEAEEKEPWTAARSRRIRLAALGAEEALKKLAEAAGSDYPVGLTEKDSEELDRVARAGEGVRDLERLARAERRYGAAVEEAASALRDLALLVEEGGAAGITLGEVANLAEAAIFGTEPEDEEPLREELRGIGFPAILEGGSLLEKIVALRGASEEYDSAFQDYDRAR